MVDEPADEAGPEDGTVLSPDELDITSEENVVELEEGRFVISPGNSQPNVVDQGTLEAHTGGTENEGGPRTDELSEGVVHDWLESRLASADSKFAFDVTARFEGEVAQRSLFSNDVVTTFENLVVWYAAHAGSDTPVEDVLGILLTESNLSVRFPAESLHRFVVANGLDHEDSLGDLFEAVREAGGLTFPPDGS